MNRIDWIICNAFLDKCNAEKRSTLLKYLSEETQDILQILPLCAADPTEQEPSLATDLDRIHYSWIAPFLRTLAENEIRFFLSALNESQSKGLKKMLLFSGSLTALNPIAKTFLCKRIIEKLTEGEKELLPTNYLPEAPLNILLTLSFPELLSLIDFLGIHDLSLEIKQIIDKTKLRDIYNVLSSDEQLYLKHLLQQKEPLVFRSMGLNKWDGRPESLKATLHQRGLNRLAKALLGQDESLIWHITHYLDSERGHALLKFSTPLENPKASSILAGQVLELIPHLKTITLSKSS